MKTRRLFLGMITVAAAMALFPVTEKRHSCLVRFPDGREYTGRSWEEVTQKVRAANRKRSFDKVQEFGRGLAKQEFCP